MHTIKSHAICDQATAHDLSCYVESTLGSDDLGRWTERFTAGPIDFVSRAGTMFLRYGGVNLEPGLAWKKDGQWVCSNARIARRLCELTGLDVAFSPES